MAMLERIKKKQWEGLKEFVQSLEVTPLANRQMIFLNGVLEDPIFMTWVMKNLKGMDDFLSLPGDEIEVVMQSSENILPVVVKALGVQSDQELLAYENSFRRYMGKLRDELSYLKEVPIGERDAARFFLIKTVRKLQNQERIQGFRWQLPPQDVFYDRPGPKEGVMQIQFESGVLAAEGEVLKGKRIGLWRHFYDTGKLLAEGNYQEGLKVGAWAFFYGTGQPKAEGKYLADVRHGLWKEWDRQGQLEEVEYLEGKRQT